MNKSIVIIGPTASGKSDIAIEIAKKYNGEIISADSRQIYRGMDIGTGKIPRDADNGRWSVAHKKKIIPYYSDGIAHYMIDIVSPNTPYNVAKFTKKASAIRKDIWDRGKLPIICGGTGFWAQALAEDMQFPEVPPNKEFRKKLDKKSTEDLYTELLQLDPERAKAIEPNNRVHMIRAIEIHKTLGKVPKIKNYKLQAVSSNTLVIAITLPKDELHSKIEKRFDLWLDGGLLDEIYDLHTENNIPWKRLESFGLEYKWGSQYIRGLITKKEFREFTLRDIRRYAKRQMTWIRRWDKNRKDSIRYVEPYTKSIFSFVSNFLK